MKNILTLLLFSIGFAVSQAQNCAVQIHETNNPTAPHSLEAFASPANIPVKFVWSSGETVAKIFPKQSGDYCVTTTDANGCIANACRTVVVNGNACSAQISYDSLHNVMVAHASGAAPFTYSWSSGATTATSPAPTAAGTICVTVTDATGCAATTCFNFHPQQTCIVKISTFTTATGITLTANFAPSNPASPAADYQWSNGATTSSITVFHPGQYCVTASEPNGGCSAHECIDIHHINKLDVNVGTTNTTNADAEVFLITYDTAQGGILTAVQTVNTDQFGLAQFQNIPAGNYLVKAALRSTSPDYDKFLPTYYEHNLFWSGATTVGIGALSPSVAPQNIKLTMIPGQNPGGPGFVGGLVVQGANLMINDSRGDGDPIAGVQIILEKADGTPFAATKTAANGKFAFDNLPYGSYKISIDIPGIPVASTTVELTAAKPEITTANFKVDDDSAVFTAVENPIFEQLFVAPNPTRDVLKIQLPTQKFDLTLANLQGQILTQTFENQSAAQLDLSNLPTGIYILQIRSGLNLHTEKVLKN